jgi:hypothetical protein
MMLVPTGRLAAWVLLAAAGMAAQPAAYLKNSGRAGSEPGGSVLRKSRSIGRTHYIVQFLEPNPQGRDLLESQGYTVLRYLPDRGYVVSAGPVRSMDSATLVQGAELAIGQFDPLAKISAALQSADTGFVVEFHPDVSDADARAILLGEQFVLVENPDLAPGHLVATGTMEHVRSLVLWDEVAYVFPASQDLMNGAPQHPCAGPLTQQGSIGQYVARIGEGWDGAGQGAAALTFAFGNLTGKLPADSVQSELERAMLEWAKVVKVSFQYTTDLRGNRSITFLFASGDHGDGYPFDGPGKVLAHTFYPAPPNPEPVAGDMHLDGDETWRVGADVDLFSVALHEMGHALGLGHSDVPTAIMYPYYQRATTLTSEDRNAILTMYAAQDGTPSVDKGSSATPVSLVIDSNPPVVTTAATLALSGTVTGGTGNISVTWSASAGGSGTAEGGRVWTATGIPLVAGTNTITVTARDASGLTVVRNVLLSRQVIAPPSPVDVRITAPLSNPVTLSAATLTIAGTAAQASGIKQVRWSTARGDSGVATGAASWSAVVALAEGANSVTITAVAADGTTGSALLTATCSKAAAGPDKTAPTLTIISPQTTMVSTNSSSLTFTGTATDNIGVTEVTWTNGTATGTAAGTADWTAQVPLLVGSNTVVIRAWDAAGSSRWRSVIVTRK